MQFKKKRWIQENIYGGDAAKTEAACKVIKEEGGRKEKHIQA
jgi:hypothetical protein